MIRAVALAIAVAAAGPAAVTDLGTLPGGYSATVFGISSGYAVGTSSSADAFQRAFVYDAGGMHDLGGLGALTNSSAADVNAAGHVVGMASSENAVESQPVRWVDGAIEDLGDLGGGSGGALGVNDNDVIVGWSTITPQDGSTHGFRWANGTMEDLDAVLPKPAGSTVESAAKIDDAGHIVGRLALADGQRVGYWTDGSSMRQIQLSLGESSDANDIGPSGTVAATSWQSSGSRAFVWRDGTSTELPAPLGDGCASATAVAGNGDIAGWSSLCGRSVTRAVIWRDGIPADVQVLVDPSTGILTRSLTSADAGGRVGGFGDHSGGPSLALVVDPAVSSARVAGIDSVGTGIEAFRRLGPGPRFGVVVAASDAPADLALAAFFAARRGFPLLVNPRGHLDERVATVLREPSYGSTVYLVGGTASLAPAVEQSIAALGLRPERLAGTDRFGTSAAVAAAAGGASSILAVDGQDTTTAISAVPLAAHRRAGIVFIGPGHPAPAGARVVTAADRDALAAELAPHPIAPTVARFTRLSDGAVGAVLASRAGSPLRWVEQASAGDVFLVGGTAVLQAS